MIVKTIAGVVTAQAESLGDVRALMGLIVKKKAFKKSVMLNCEECNQSFKGVIGLGLHNAKMHKTGAGSTIEA